MIVKGKDIAHDDIKKILVIQLGDIGDVVWATPTFHSLKKAYPKASMYVLLRHGAGSLLQADPVIENIFEVPAPRDNFHDTAAEQLHLIRRLRREHFDLLFDLRADERGAITGFLSGATHRVARYFQGPVVPFWRNALFSHLVQAPAPALSKRTYGAAEQSLGVLRGFGIAASTTLPKLWVSAVDEQKVSCILAEKGITEQTRWISINPFSRWSYKEWDLEKWTAIIEWLYEAQGIVSVLVGARSERERIFKVVEYRSSAAVNLVGTTSLGELAALLSKSSLHIGVDSAAPHIAAATGTPTVTIYGPTSWKDWAPVGENHHVIVPSDPCSPCHQKGCDGSGRSRCLENLGIERVKDGIHHALADIGRPF